jgi:plastocyanin
MRKLLALSGAAVVAATLGAGPAFAGVATKPKPPVTLQGKVTNKGTKTVKKGKVKIEADNYNFNATFLKAKQGTTVTVSLKNDTKTQHTFTIDALGIDQTLNPDQKATVTLTLPATGATNYYCRFHGPNGTQGDLGMQGAFFSQRGESVNTGSGTTPPSSAPTPTNAAPTPTTATARTSGGMSGY